MFSNSDGRVEESAFRLRKETKASRKNEKTRIKRMKTSHVFIVVVSLTNN